VGRAQPDRPFVSLNRYERFGIDIAVTHVADLVFYAIVGLGGSEPLECRRFYA
jgi:hypothetical protein